MAANFFPETILAGSSDINELTIPPVKVGSSLYVAKDQILYGIDLAEQPSVVTSYTAGQGHRASLGKSSSNYVFSNGRFYSVTEARNPSSPVAILKNSYISFSVIQDGIPQTRNETIGTSVLAGKYYLPTGAIAADASGNIYVADRSNATGTAGSGVIWKIVPVADSANHTASVFHDFNGQNIDEGNNSSFLLVNGDYLYGLNSAGGSSSKGTLFRKKLDGSEAIQVLHTFNTEGVPDGDLRARSALLIEGEWLYGTITDWNNSVGHGIAFRIKPDGTTFSVLHSFTGTDGDGSKPAGPLAIKDGWIYGTTLQGGENNSGAIYRINTADGSYEQAGSFSAVHIKPLGLIYDAGTDAFYGTTQGSGTNGAGTTVFKLVEEKAFEISLTTSATSVDLGKNPLTLNWSVQAAPNDVVCTASSNPANTDWDNPSLTLEADGNKKKGSGTTDDLAGVHSNMQANSDGSGKANNFTLTCASASDPGNTRTATATVTAHEPAALETSFNAVANPVSGKVNLYWSVTSPGSAGGECRGTSDPVDYWSGTYTFGSTTGYQVDFPTANGRTGVHPYTFTLVCERNEKDLRNPENNTVTKTASIEFDFGQGSGGTSSSAASSSTSSAPASSNSSSSVAVSSVAVSSSSSSATVIESNKSGGGGAMNLWWMLSLCLLALGRRVKV